MIPYIKLYIVTYNNKIDLENNIKSILDSDLSKVKSLEINIINNHSNFELSSELEKEVKVYHNTLRPDFSTGHLARNWNQAIINGFKDLNNPDCNLVITCQDDTIFVNDWLYFLLELHDNFNFVQMGIGDNFCSYTPEAIKKVGLWNEIYSGLGFQEADYFLRNYIYNRDGACINDFQHGRFINAVNFTICHRPQPPDIFSEDHKKSMKYHYINEKVFKLNWPNVPPNYWTPEVFSDPPKRSATPLFIQYPYFEKDVYDLAEKGYII